MNTYTNQPNATLSLLNARHNKPQVSVVIPMYNVGKYIERCISSVLSQSFTDFEVICVDDGCTDNTLEILASFDDPRISLVVQENRGLAGARNTGINLAQGQYIALLDSDDFWHKDKLALHAAHLDKQQNVGISYCPSLFVDDDDNLMGVGQFPKLTNITDKHILTRNPIGNGSAPVIRKAMLIDYVQSISNSGSDIQTNHNSDFNGNTNSNNRNIKANRIEYFNEQLRQSEDIEFWLRICLNSQWKFEGIAQPLTYYRVNANGLSSNLPAQFSSWKTAMAFNKKQHNEFFKNYYQLAKAYQYRYFARRSIQASDHKQAWFYITKAINTDKRVLLEEPARTLNTLLCAVLINLLPSKVYKKAEQLAMNSVQRFSQIYPH